MDVWFEKLGINDVGDDLHVAMTVGAETLIRLYPVFVDHTQIAKAHMIWVVVVSEREAVLTVKPAKVSRSALIAFSYPNHRCIS